jgi:hypothetical protein
MFAQPLLSSAGRDNRNNVLVEMWKKLFGLKVEQIIKVTSILKEKKGKKRMATRTNEE